MQVLPRKLTAPANAAVVLLAAFCVAYVSDAGHGFIKDDFRWIRETRVESAADLARLFERTDGFYRPLVSLTFAFNSSTSGLGSRAFGLTNFAMAVGNAVLVWLLGRKLGLGTGAALVAAAAWAFNFHGINMAILWISGRTALMVTLCALSAGILTASGRMWLAAVFCLLAMLSKEEAVLLPVVLTAWSLYDARGSVVARVVPSLRRCWPCFAAIAIYLVLRLRTEAFWPGDAPQYYRFTFSPSLLAWNIVQYMDRAITWPAFAALVAYAASARHAHLDPIEKRVVIFGGAWLVGLFAVTVLVPVRSSLYAVLPSAGSALAAGAVMSAALRAAPQRTTAGLTALALLPLFLVPIYWRRNERWVRLADISTHVIDQVRTVSEREPGRRILIVDNPAERFNLDAAFGNLWPDAAALFLPPSTAATMTAGDATPSDAVVLRLENGALTRIPRPAAPIR